MPALTKLTAGSDTIVNTKEFNTANFTSLQSLILDDGALKYCNSFIVKDVPQLTRLEIGSSCCMNADVFSLECGVEAME